MTILQTVTMVQKKQVYLDKLAAFLSGTTEDYIQLKIDNNEYVTGTYNGQSFEYSVCGDNKNGMFRDTLRALIREAYMEEL